MKVTWNLNFSVHEYSFVATQPCSFIYVLSAAAFTQRRVVATKNIWPTRANSLWNSCYPVIYTKSSSTPDSEKRDGPQPPSEAYPWTGSTLLAHAHSWCTQLHVHHADLARPFLLELGLWCMQNICVHAMLEKNESVRACTHPTISQLINFPLINCVVLGTCNASGMCLWQSCMSSLIFEH